MDNYMYGNLNEEKGTVSVDTERYHQLLKKEAWADALDAAGVDNWQGIDMAIDIYKTFK